MNKFTYLFGKQLEDTSSDATSDCIYADRVDAGRVLASKLTKYANRSDVVVFGLPRGGVIVANEVAQALGAPLDVFIVRKIGTPGHRELAMGAIASGGIYVLNKKLIEYLNVPQPLVQEVLAEEFTELERREKLYWGKQDHKTELNGITAILVDDGMATGSSMLAALRAARSRAPKRLIVAVPVAAGSTCRELSEEADEIICAAAPDPFQSVGQWYEDFSQTSDDEVTDCLRLALQRTTWPEPGAVTAKMSQ
jgi:putative phosphoribosyl transferase